MYAAAGGIAAVAIAILFVTGAPGAFRMLPGGQEGNNNQTSQQAFLQPELSIKDIVVERTGNESATVQVIFDMRNPNPSPLLLQALQYSVNVGGFRMTVGDIGGTETSADLTQISSERSVPLRDTSPPVVLRNNLNAESWDSMVAGTAEYEVTGSYSYMSIARLGTSSDVQEFTFTFPP